MTLMTLIDLWLFGDCNPVKLMFFSWFVPEWNLFHKIRQHA